MHDYLKQCIRSLSDFWQCDPRATAFSVNGSGGRGTDDEWSDADVLLVVGDEYYQSVRNEMREHMQNLCGGIRIWLPEGEADRYINYAFLFEKDGEQFLFDHALFCESWIGEYYTDAGEILFDKSGALTAASLRYKERKPWFDATAIPGLIDKYLLYAYINGKYYRRRDYIKMQYLQNTLKDIHLQIMQAVHNETPLSGWWCADIRNFSTEQREVIMLYASAPDCNGAAHNVIRELACFCRDAEVACSNTGFTYPKENELYVLRQLKDAGLPVV